MNMTASQEFLGDTIMAYHVLRYTPNLVRDESLNIGVLVFDPKTGDSRLRMVEEPREFARIRRLLPSAEEDVLRGLRDHLEDRFATQLESERSKSPKDFAPGAVLQRMVRKWSETLSNSVQLVAVKGVHSADLEHEADRLFAELVAMPRSAQQQPERTHGRADVREYCKQVFQQARIWDRIQKSIRASEFTYVGDPLRIDFGYRRNGTRGFVHALSVTRAPRDCTILASTAERIAKRAPFASEFTVVTDVVLEPEQNKRHNFVRETFRDAGIVSLDKGSFAAWVPKLKAQLN